MFVVGELTTKAVIKNRKIREIVRKITGEKYKVEIRISKQSPEISRGVDIGGAGDQGIMIGYACNENKEMIPQELYLARSLCKFIYSHHQYDGKTQVTIDNKGNIETIVVSFCKVNSNELVDLTYDWIYRNHPKQVEKREIAIYCNPAGDWNIGGFEADAGLTGRKLAVDSYGPRVPLGGGAFSGKDSTKVDRSGAYIARRIAVDLLESRQAKEVFVKIAYSIGVAEPVMVTATIDGKNERVVGYDLTPKGIIKKLKLKKPLFSKTAEWGHFGNKFNWDK